MGSLPFASPTNTGQWAQDLLTALGDPLTQSNIGYLEAWQHAESPSGYGYNPLGTEQTAPGSTNANSAGVQAFQSWAQGISATVATFTGYAGNSKLLALLKKGNATTAQLDAAQRQGSWATGGESSIAGPGTSTAFTYGGLQGEQLNAKGYATGGSGVTAIQKGLQQELQQAGSGLNPSQDLSNIGSNVVSGVFGPVAKWIEKGAADVTFIGFGLLLIIVGLSVTFHSETQDVVGVASKVAE